ncbi:MAG: hypothetical protein AB7V27_07180 [Candidatus Binatia bacterium]
MKRMEILAAALFGCAFVAAGCGVDVEIIADARVITGGTQKFAVKLANVSNCPLASPSAASNSSADFVLLPLIPAAQIAGIADICLPTGEPAYPLSAQLDEHAQFPVEAARSALLSSAQNAQAVSCAGTGVICEPIPGIPLPSGGLLCQTPPLGIGEMVTLECETTVPANASGKLFTVAGSAMVAAGVCKSGPGQGQPCFNDLNCGTGGDCGQGICTGGGNNSFGCDVNASATECSGGQCIACQGSSGIGVACEAFSVLSPAAAPAAGPWGATLITMALVGVAGYQMRRSWRK